MGLATGELRTSPTSLQNITGKIPLQHGRAFFAYLLKIMTNSLHQAHAKQFHQENNQTKFKTSNTLNLFIQYLPKILNNPIYKHPWRQYSELFPRVSKKNDINQTNKNFGNLVWTRQSHSNLYRRIKNRRWSKSSGNNRAKYSKNKISNPSNINDQQKWSVYRKV